MWWNMACFIELLPRDPWHWNHIYPGPFLTEAKRCVWIPVMFCIVTNTSLFGLMVGGSYYCSNLVARHLLGCVELGFSRTQCSWVLFLTVHKVPPWTWPFVFCFGGNCVLTHGVYSLFPGMPVPLLCHDLPSIFCRPLSHLCDKVIAFLSAVVPPVISGVETRPYLTSCLISSPLVQSQC